MQPQKGFGRFITTTYPILVVHPTTFVLQGRAVVTVWFVCVLVASGNHSFDSHEYV
jgi:hypothetical protein